MRLFETQEAEPPLMALELGHHCRASGRMEEDELAYGSSEKLLEALRWLGEDILK